jgi:hypothetical protein
MKLISSGFIPGDFPENREPAYCLLDTEFEGASVNILLQELTSRVEGSFTGDLASGSQVDDAIYINSLPSIWAPLGYGSSQGVQLVDVGFGMSVAGYSGAETAISFSDGRAVNGYSRLAAATSGGLFICLSPTSQDLSGSYNTKKYSTGVLVQCDYDSRGTLYIYFTDSGEAFFFHTVNFNAPVGYMAPNTRFVNIFGYCKPYHLYCLKSFVAVASGTVENAVGDIAPNCKVFMYRRSDGKLLGSAVSDSEGKYSMNTLANKDELVFMICLDDDEAPDFEGIIYDRIIV